MKPRFECPVFRPSLLFALFCCHYVHHSGGNPCVIDGYDLTGVPPLTFTLPLEGSASSSNWRIGFCRRVDPPDDEPCALADSPGFLQHYQEASCVKDFTVFSSIKPLANGVRIMLQQPPEEPSQGGTMANVKILCNISVTGVAEVAMSTVKVVEDLGDYVLTFHHACACRGVCHNAGDGPPPPHPSPLLPPPPLPSPPPPVTQTPTLLPPSSLPIQLDPDTSSSPLPGHSLSPFTSPATSPAPSPLPSPLPTPLPSPLPTPLPSPMPSPLPSQSPQTSPSPRESPSPLQPPSPIDLCRGVVCVARDQCHEVGECDPTTGLCSNPPKPDGTSCTDHNTRTFLDQCKDGECIGLSLFCAGRPCKNGGRCIDQREACECVRPWGGPTCEEELPDPCYPDPCLNGGNCSVVMDTARCACPEAFIGPTCASPAPVVPKTPTASPPAPSPPAPSPPAPSFDEISEEPSPVPDIEEPKSPDQEEAPAVPHDEDAWSSLVEEVQDSPKSPSTKPAGPDRPSHWLSWVVVAFLCGVGGLAIASQVAQARGYCLKSASYRPMQTDFEMEDMDVNPFAH